jgi:hypothetical protein
VYLRILVAVYQETFPTLELQIQKQMAATFGMFQPPMDLVNLLVKAAA